MKKEVYKKMLFSVIAKNLNWKILTRIQLLLKDGMGVKDKKFNIMQVHWNGGHKKQYIGNNCLKRRGGGLDSLQI